MDYLKDFHLPIDSPNLDKEFQKKYNYLSNLKHFYQEITTTWAYLNRLFYSETLTSMGGSSNYNQQYFKRNIEIAKLEVAKPSFYLKLVDNKVEISVNLPKFELNLDYNHTYFTDGKYKEYVELIRNFIPDFSLPTTYKSKKIKSTIKDTTKILPQFARTTKRKQSLSQLINNLPNISPYEYWEGPDSLSLSKTFLDTFDKDTTVYFEVNKSSFILDIVDSLSSKTVIEKEGNLNFNGILNYEISTIVNFSVPIEYALWVTDSSNIEEFSLKRFAYFMNCRHSYYCGSRKKGDVPQKVGSLKKVKDWVENRITNLNLSLPKRINSEGYTILRDGKVVWIDPSDNVELFHKRSDKAYNENLSQVIPNSKIKEVCNIPLYLDWLNNKFIYTGLKGNIEMEDLTGSTSLDNITLYDILIETVSKNYLLLEFFKLVDQQSIKLDLHFPSVKVDVGGYTMYCTNVSEAMEQLIYYDNDFKLINFFDNYTLIDQEEDSEKDIHRKKTIHKLVTKVSNHILGLYKEFNSMKCAYSTKIKNRIYFDIFKSYGKNYHFYKQELDLSLALNKPNFNPPSNYQLNIPNISNLTHSMPHQLETLYSLESDPKSIALDIQPGGGKSIILISHFLRLLEQRLIRRPLLVVPNNLAKEMLTEGYTISGGNLNIVVLRQDTVDRFLDTKNGIGFSVDKLVDYVKSAPINTIFVTTYSFLKGQRDLYTRKILKENIYTTTTVKLYPNVEFLLRCNFDIVALDESQKIANQSSQQSQATARLVAGIERKVISSGTLIRNNPTDLIGQTAIFNPRIFSSKREFLNKYTIEGSSKSKRSVVLAPGAEDQIQKVLNRHIHRISKKRRDWSFLLPIPKEQFHFVEMTDNQRTFYEAILSNAIDKIYEELGSVLNSTTKTYKDTNRIEEALKRHLQKVEKFLVAPDSNEAFLSLPNLTELDKISPKVHIVNKILKAHFGKGDEDLGVKSDPDYKVIIYGYHKVASEHIYRNLENKSQALHYRSGDDKVITRFRRDPAVKVLVADELSLREGLNLQMGSKIIRLQTLWTPGDQEQSRSRIDRPDPRGLYKRTQTTNEWILINQSLEVAKTARLFTKIIDKAKIDEVNNTSWRKIRDQFKQIELVKMDLNTLENYQTQEDLEEHFKNYKIYKNWHQEQFQKARENLQETLEKSYKKTIPMDKLRDYAMKPIINNYLLEGSSKIYTPWVPGATIVSGYDIPLEPLELLVEEDEEGNIKTEDSNVKIDIGSVVETEFGLGYIKLLRSKTVTVTIPNYKTVTLPKSVVFSTLNSEDNLKLHTILETSLNTNNSKYLLNLITCKSNKDISERRYVNFKEYNFKEDLESKVSWIILKPKSNLKFKSLLKFLRLNFSIRKSYLSTLDCFIDKFKEYNSVLLINDTYKKEVEELNPKLPFTFNKKNTGTYNNKPIVNPIVWVENSIFGVAIPISKEDLSVKSKLEHNQLELHNLCKLSKITNITIT